MPQTKSELTAVRLTPAELAAVQQAATLLDVTISDLVRRALDNYLNSLGDADTRRKNEGNNGHAAVETA
jgi:hypothetical protein